MYIYRVWPELGPVWQNPWFVKPPRPLVLANPIAGPPLRPPPGASSPSTRQSLLGTAELPGSGPLTESFWRWNLPALAGRCTTGVGCPAAMPRATRGGARTPAAACGLGRTPRLSTASAAHVLPRLPR